MDASLAGMPEVGDVIGSKYRLQEVIGSGAVGVVYEATHELIGRVVALKWLLPRLAADDVLATRFLREARAACVIDHPNVVEVFDAGRDRDSLYLVMERLRGEPFSDWLDRGVRDPEILIATLMPALRGICAAHEHGVVHRDLKPENIFLAKPRHGRPGGAKVLDFGISKLRDPTAQLQLTSAGMMMGTPCYMAPEQIADSSTVDERADIYSLGVMLYEGLTGRLPHDADSLAKLFHRITSEKPEPIHRDSLPPGLEAVVLRAMAARPENRFPDVASLARALEPFSGGVGLHEPSGSPGDIASEATTVSASAQSGIAEIEAAPTRVSDRDSIDETGRDTDPQGPEEENPLRPIGADPRPGSRAMAMLRGEAPQDFGESVTHPLIPALRDEGLPTTDPPPPPSDTDPEAPSPGIAGPLDELAEAATLELDRDAVVPADALAQARREAAEVRPAPPPGWRPRPWALFGAAAALLILGAAIVAALL